MPTIPANFSGSKFAAKYNLEPFDFSVTVDQLFCPSLPNLQDADLLDCVVTPAELAEIVTEEQAVQDLKDQYLWAHARLVEIKDKTTWTNAEMIAAVKDEAKILLKITEIEKRRLT